MRVESSVEAKPAPRISFGSAVRVVAIAAAAVAVILGARMIGADRLLLELVGWIRGAGWVGMLVFVLVYVGACIAFVPASILTLGAGFAWGVAVGTPLVWAGACIGATAAFILGRTALREWVAFKVRGNKSLEAIDQAVGKSGLKIVLLTRLSPVFPFNLLNYAFGLTRVTLRDYAAGTAVGIVPGTLMYVYLGSLVTSLSEIVAGRAQSGKLQEALYFGGLLITVIVTVYVTRVARKALAEASGETGRSA